MKIVHITTVHDPFDNRIFYKECISLVKMGHEVILIAVHDRDWVFRGVRIRALEKAKNRLHRILVVNLQAFKLALAEDADIYHFHDPEFIIPAMLMKLRGKKRIVYDVHEDYYSLIKIKGYLPLPILKIIATIFTAFEKVLTKQFARVLAEKYYQEKFSDGVKVLNYPSCELLDMPVNKYHDLKMQFIYTGNITEDRGALEHAKIVNTIDRAWVYLVGKCDRNYAEKLYQLVGSNQNRLIIEGVERFVPFKSIKEYYSRGNWTAGLALFPPNPHYVKKELTKFFEYMSAGIPIVCSNFVVWKKLIEDTGAGLCVNPEKEDEVEEALEYLYSNRDQAMKMGQNGRICVEKYFRWEDEAVKLEGLYKDLMKEF